jgi:hypothetical protein
MTTISVMTAYHESRMAEVGAPTGEHLVYHPDGDTAPDDSAVGARVSTPTPTGVWGTSLVLTADERDVQLRTRFYRYMVCLHCQRPINSTTDRHHPYRTPTVPLRVGGDRYDTTATVPLR